MIAADLSSEASADDLPALIATWRSFHDPVSFLTPCEVVSPRGARMWNETIERPSAEASPPLPARGLEISGSDCSGTKEKTEEEKN
jgi:hypothetical protein